MELYLIRHTRPALEGAICYGRLDVGLCEGWDAEAASVRSRLPADAGVVTGPERRCRDLAAALVGDGAPVVPDADLRELDFGAWEGLPWADIPRHETRFWATDVWNRAPHGGETYAALHARVTAAWGRLLLMASERIVVIGSLGPLRALLTIALELPHDSFARFHLEHAGITLLSDAQAGWRLQYANR